MCVVFVIVDLNIELSNLYTLVKILLEVTSTDSRKTLDSLHLHPRNCEVPTSTYQLSYDLQYKFHLATGFFYKKIMILPELQFS